MLCGRIMVAFEGYAMAMKIVEQENVWKAQRRARAKAQARMNTW